MRRGRERDIGKYIDMRVSQLEEDRDKASDDYDRQWYNRIISELLWAKTQDHDCFMEWHNSLEVSNDE